MAIINPDHEAAIAAFHRAAAAAGVGGDGRYARAVALLEPRVRRDLEARAEPQAPSAPVGVEVGASLWCLHILGPDDVIPAPSRAYAERAAQKLNEWYARQPKGEHCPPMEAVAAPWPHDAKSHADDVETFIERWILPSGQVQAAARALAQQPAAVDGAKVSAALSRLARNEYGDPRTAAANRSRDIRAVRDALATQHQEPTT